jgi:hypothetical protein
MYVSKKKGKAFQNTFPVCLPYNASATVPSLARTLYLGNCELAKFRTCINANVTMLQWKGITDINSRWVDWFIRVSLKGNNCANLFCFLSFFCDGQRMNVDAVKVIETERAALRHVLGIEHVAWSSFYWRLRKIRKYIARLRLARQDKSQDSQQARWLKH